MTYLLLPGRQIVNTLYQEEALQAILGTELSALPYMIGEPPPGRVTDIVFAVTSCNKSNSRFNPLPFEVRSILVYEFCRPLQERFGVHFHIVGIPHYPPSSRFAATVLKEMGEQSEGQLTLTPINAAVFTSTPAIIDAYAEMGFAVLPGEYDRAAQKYTAPTPRDVVQQIGDGVPLQDIPLSASTRAVFHNFPDAPRRIARLFHDPILTEQGDLTETRNYATYARDMGGAIDFKYAEIKPFVRPGKIVDEGCADGALARRLASDFPDSDILGVDLSAEMLARAQEAKRAGAFGGAFVFFHQRNLMTPVSDAEARTADTVICNSTLHELWSYGNKDNTVRAYLRGKWKQLRPGGHLVIRDVVGPDNLAQTVWLWCDPANGGTSNDENGPPAELSTHARFGRFCRDFRPGEPRPFIEMADDGESFVLPLGYAMEFVSKMDYTENWQSEMHEAFCFWSFADWVRELGDAGFLLVPASHAYTSAWRVEHSFQGRVRLFTVSADPLPFPVTNMVLAGEKPLF